MNTRLTVEEIYHAARQKSDPAERAGFLERACGNNAALRARVEALLNADAAAGKFLAEGTQVGDPEATIPRPAGAADFHALAPSEQTAEVIGRYKLLQPIGEGGFGVVYMAEQREPVKRRVALKVIKLGMDTKQVIARFEAERQALALMDHPNIARVLDAGSTETGRPYFVMEYIKGVPILEYCDTDKLDTQQRLDLFVKVCGAIQHAHQKGIIHRDIKPSNVLVTMHDGVPVPKVIDFGIAKATSAELTTRTLFTEHRQMIGTPAYMSPEQAEMSGLDIDTRSDIYSLGVLLYELLTGTTPFDTSELLSKGFAEMMRIIREVEPHKPSTRLSSLGETGTRTAQQRRANDPKRLSQTLRGDLDWIVMKCLEKDRTRRYETANGLAMDIQRHLGDEPVTAAAPSAAYKFQKFVRRNRGPVAAGLLVAAALVLGLIGTSVGLFKAERALAAEAEQRKQADAARAEAQAQQARAEAQEAEARKQEAQAREQAAIAEAVAKFQTDMLAAVDPNHLPRDPVTGEPLKDAVTVVQALAGAVNVLDEGSLKDQPLVEARVRETIGRTLAALARYAEAEPNLRKALVLRRAALPAGHPDIAAGLNNLAELLRTRNKLAEAEPLYREALEITRAALPAGHPVIARSLDNLAKLLQERNNLAEAEPLFREALEIRRAALPAGHPDIALGLNNLAILLREQNKHAETEPLLREAVEIYRAALPAGHPDIAASVNNLAALLRALNKLDEADSLLREALEIRRAALPAGHPDIASSLNNLGVFYWQQGKLDQSIPLFEEALKVRETVLGRRHPGTLGAIANLGVNYKDAGRLAEAIPLLEEAYQASNEHRRWGYIGLALLDAYGRAADTARPESIARVEKLAQELLGDARAQLPERSPELADQLGTVCLTLLSLKIWDQAEPLLRECLAIREKTRPDEWTTFNTKSMLGGVLLGQNKLAEAESLLLDGYRGMKEREAAIPALGPARTRIPEALERVVRLYEAWDKAEPGGGYESKAAEWRAALEASRGDKPASEAENP